MSTMTTSSFSTGSFSSLKDKQKEALIQMLNLNKSANGKDFSFEDPWKILVYDEVCRDIISPILKVGDLRKQGVTLHLLLHSERQSISEAPAVYFVMPTEENVKKICEDCKSHIYEQYYLNFASHIPRPLLEKIATSTLESDSVTQIKKIYDQYLNFISLEKDLFTLNQKDSYVTFNDPSISDQEAIRSIETVVEGLFSVLVTLQVIPIIRCPKNSAAERIAEMLDTKLSDHLTNMGNLFSNATAFHRPVLILMDRDIDLPVMLSHTWTYQALVHDLLGMKLNKIQLELDEQENQTPTKTKKVYDLDSTTDSFWAANSGSAFPKVAIEVKNQVTEYSQSYADFQKKYGSNVDLENYDESQILGKTKELGSFVTTIPILREKKRLIDAHTNIATSLLSEIKARELDTFYSLEEGMILKTSLDKKELLTVISDSKRGTLADKMRLFTIYYLTTDNIPPNDLQQLEEALSKLGADVNSLRFLKQKKSFNNLWAPASSTSGSTSGGFTSSWRKVMENVNVPDTGFGSRFNQLSSFVTSGMKSFLPVSKEFIITKIVDTIMEMKTDYGVDGYLYFDPKVQKKPGRPASIPRKTTPFKEAIVFTIGGGNYVEYQNLQDYTKKNQTKKIIYGSTEIVNAEDFLTQLKILSSKM